MSDAMPPFCARPTCPFHAIPRTERYAAFVSWGSYATKAFGDVPRFRCTHCGKTFSVQTFRVDYYAKKVLDYDGIAGRLSSCESLSAIGRATHSSTDTISNRIARSARQALAFESRLSRTRKPAENLAADGFEGFCRSQYFPNNIHILVGSTSQFLYAIDHVTLRRKGSMTQAQKAKRTKLDRLVTPEPSGIETSVARIADESLRVLSDGAIPTLVLWTDEKRDYPRGIERSPCASSLRSIGRLEHKTVSSRAARTLRNPLFPVNYLDREIRKDLHEHVRETVCFGRNVNRQMERLAVYAYWHNYRKRHRIRGDPRSNAEVAGYVTDEIASETVALWERRAWLSLTELTETMRLTWLRRRRTPLRTKRDYLPKFAAA